MTKESPTIYSTTGSIVQI